MYGIGGASLKASQIQSINNYYQSGSLNQRTQFNSKTHVLFTPALNPSLMLYKTRDGINYKGQTVVSWRDRIDIYYDYRDGKSDIKFD